MTSRWSRAAAVLFGLVVAAVGGTALLGGGGRAAARVRVAAPPTAAGDWGVRILGVRPTAGGYLLDLRFRVVDPVRAAPLFDRDVAPYLLHQRSGARLLVPRMAKLGPMRSRTHGEIGRTDFVIFANPGRLVAPGDHVTLVIGRFRAADLIVE